MIRRPVVSSASAAAVSHRSALWTSFCHFSRRSAGVASLSTTLCTSSRTCSSVFPWYRTAAATGTSASSTIAPPALHFSRRWLTTTTTAASTTAAAPRPVTLADASSTPPASSTATTASSNEEQPKPKKPFGRFAKLMKEHGFLYAAYVFIFGEVLTLAVTLLLHWDLIGAGDVVSFLKWLGMSSIESVSNKSVHVFGIELSGRLAMNYGIANVLLIPCFPAELAFCLYTLPMLKRVLGKIPFGRRRQPLTVPKAPQAEATAATPTPSLPTK